MAFLQFKNIRIAGFSASVPRNVINNLDVANISKEYSSSEFVKTTGVKQVHYSTVYTTSDLCYEAAEKLIKDLGWKKSEIEALIFVSQTPDYIEPATSCILQDKLNLSKECYAEDISLGCSGWVYALSTLAGLMQNGFIKKGLILAGDAKKRVLNSHRDPLFGHAGTVTAIEYKEGSKGFTFHFGTDGGGYDAIIIPDGGSRNPISLDSFKEDCIDGKVYNRLETRMKGMDVFSFGITTVPKSLKKIATFMNEDYLNYDYFIFHQANMKMNEFITKKLKLPNNKVPYSMPNYGNTSSASIPLTIITELKNKIKGRKTNFLCCGFGIGLSWGTVAFQTENIVISDLVEVG